MVDKIILNLIAGPLKGKKLEFIEHDTFIFGRMNDCHHKIPNDGYLSRHHFLLEANPPDARIKDLGSLNGTFVNNVKIGSRRRHESPEEGAIRNYPYVDLFDGDEIKTGDTQFSVNVIIEESLNNIIRCKRCGKDVSAEVGSRRGGEYLCSDCITNLESDPGKMLQALFSSNNAVDEKLQIPEYEIVKLLGKGGMGEVFQIRHKTNGSLRAVKILLSKVAANANAREKFMREIQTISTLVHPNIVSFFESGFSGSAFYIIMEYCNNGNLLDFVEIQNRPCTENELLPIMSGVLDGLEYAHSKGFVHRDIKPQNILLNKEGDTIKAKISDFGLSKNFAQAGFSGMTVTGNYAGSFPFMPREQLTNFKYVKPVSDVWSIGATFYYALTRRLPREMRPGEDPIEVILRGNIIPLRNLNQNISKKLAGVIDKALSNNINNRYQNAGEMKQAVEKIL